MYVYSAGYALKHQISHPPGVELEAFSSILDPPPSELRPPSFEVVGAHVSDFSLYARPSPQVQPPVHDASAQLAPELLRSTMPAAPSYLALAKSRRMAHRTTERLASWCCSARLKPSLNRGAHLLASGRGRSSTINLGAGALWT